MEIRLRYSVSNPMEPTVVESVSSLLRDYRESGFDDDVHDDPAGIKSAIDDPMKFLMESMGSYAGGHVASIH